MPRKILLLASSALIVALLAVNFILNTQPAKAGANSYANARAAKPEIKSGLAEASPAASPTDSCDIPVKIKGVKVTPVAGRVGNNNVSVEWEVSELPRSVAIDSFNVIAMMARNGARGELTVNGRTRRATLKVIGKDDGGDCIVTVTARGHATVTGTNQVKGRFWAR